MIFVVLGSEGRMGSLHKKHLIELGHTVLGIDPKKDLKYGDWTQLKADGVIIATPADQHVEQMVEAIEAKIPVFVEKPVCLIGQRRQCRKILNAAKQDGVSVHVGYNLRFHPDVVHTKNYLVGHEEPPISATFTMRQIPQRPIANFLEEWASHEVDLALHIMGEPVKAIHTGDDVHVMRTAILHKNGGVSVVHADDCSPTRRRSFYIVTSQAAMVGHDIEYSHHVQDFHYMNEIMCWLEHLRQPPGYTSNLATGEDGLRVIDLLA